MTLPRASLVLLVPLVGAVLAGCAGGGPGSGLGPDVLFDADTGAIRGTITDEELRPLPGAQAGLEGVAGAHAQTDAAGAFVLSLVPPGRHDLVVSALGHEGRRLAVEVEAGKVTQVTFTLPSLPSDAAYVEVFPFAGFQACQWYVPIGLAHCTVGYTIAHGTANESGVDPTAVGLPADIQDNRDKYNFSVRDPEAEIVSELLWTASSSAATYQALILACAWYNPTVDECVPPGETHTGTRYFGRVGTSPIQVTWTHPEPDHLPWVMSRANVNGRTDDLRPAGLALDQRIEMYNSVFYGMEAPEGYTAGPPDP